MKIGLLGSGFVEWNGGLEFLMNVYRCLSSADVPCEIFVIIPRKGTRAKIRKAGRALLNWRYRDGEFRGAFRSEHSVRAVRQFSEISREERVYVVAPGARPIRALAANLQLDVLLPSFQVLPASIDIPWIGYLADLQHKYLKELFSESEKRKRDRHFDAMIHAARSILVNSKSVKSDLIEFYGAAETTVTALPFSASALNSWFECDPREVAVRYELQEPYFIICNQFWKHKGHRTAFLAFAELAEQVPEVSLVCTGSLEDYRDPTYFNSLQRILKNRNLEKRVKILGLIPKIDQIGLLRNAIAVVQPTLFEGGPGGGCVFDAISVGVPAIVSDIAINRELMSEEITFFRAESVESLRDEMLSCFQRKQPSSVKSAEQLLAEGLARRQKCGNVILGVIERVLK
jgi:glycosyltransferase involved in cell wall biosynthesis